ncbi:hypothetical protein OIU76_014910 [Salix suchowensis]|nr:hypothetical protein OIU76_014910 [Salix suchowensis]
MMVDIHIDIVVNNNNSQLGDSHMSTMQRLSPSRIVINGSSRMAISSPPQPSFTPTPQDCHGIDACCLSCYHVCPENRFFPLVTVVVIDCLNKTINDNQSRIKSSVPIPDRMMTVMNGC